LSEQVPPVPAFVHQHTPSTEPGAKRRATRGSSAPPPNTSTFPDDLSDFFPPTDEPAYFDARADPSASVNFSVPAIRQIYQIPAGIVRNPDSESEDSIDELINCRLENRQLDFASAVPPHQSLIPNNESALLENILPINGFQLGTVFSIDSNEDFDMLGAFPNSLISMTRILHYCKNAAVPLYLVDGILKIVSEEVKSGRLDLTNTPSYRTTMKDLKSLFRVPLPQMVSVPLERTLDEQRNGIFPRTPTFPVFSFIEQLQDLLSMSDVFRDIDNLHVNKANPWLPYDPGNDDVEEMQDGEWFRNSCAPHSTDPIHFNIGIILYTDKTGKGELNPHGMEPVVFTLTLLRESVRRQPDCWRPLGFVPQFRKSSSALERVEKQSKITTSRSVRNYHLVLDTILAGLIECQRSPPIVRIRFGNEWKFCVANIFMEALLGDALSNDVVTARVQNRSHTSFRLCRACHTPTSLSNDPRHRCMFLVQRAIERITLSALGPEEDLSNPHYFNQWDAFVDEMVSETPNLTDSQTRGLRRKYAAGLTRRKAICTEILRVVLGSHVVDNTFFRVNTGDNPRGIFGLAPTDPMHAVEEGVIPYVVEVIISPLPDSAKKILDGIVEALFSRKSNRSSQRADYPRISFSGGYSSLTQLSADEKVGKLFALAIIAETALGREVLKQRCDPDFDAKRKERAGRFKPTEEVYTLDPLVDETVQTAHVDATSNVTNGEADILTPTRYSNMDFDPANLKHANFVNSQLQVHGLSYLLDFISQMSEQHSTLAKKIVWNLTRSLIKTDSFLTDQVQIPNKEDETFPAEFRASADRRTQLHSNHTSLSDSRFYAPNPVELNTPVADDDLEDLPSAANSVDCGSVDDLIELIHLLLAFHAFYKYGMAHFGTEGLESIDLKVRQLMLKLQARIDRGEKSTGWCISKFHDILHMAMDMQSFGCSENIDTSKGEHGLKLWAKLPSRTTQTSHGADKFIEQLANRLYEQTLIDKAHSILVPKLSCASRTRKVLELPTFAITTATKNSFRVNWKLQEHKVQNIELNPHLLDWFCSKQNKVASREGVLVYSRMFLEDFGLTFRASPDYLGTGPWYDWILVEYLDSNEQKLHYPFKIMGFVDKDDGTGPICFGQMCSTQNKKEKEESTLGLFEQWHLETKPSSGLPVFRFVEVNTIIEHCLAFQIPESCIDVKYMGTDLTNKIIVVKNRHTIWPEIFLRGIGKRKKVQNSARSRKRRG
jgi:hypothetical protein